MAEHIGVDHLQSLMDHVTERGSVTNRECRHLTGLGYDSAIKIFGALCTMGTLKKIGEASATKYVLPKDPITQAERVHDHVRIDHIATIVNHASMHGSITNRELRSITGLSYNSAIRIFGALCSLGMLRKVGLNSATKYIVAPPSSPLVARPGFHRKHRL
jgi:predicted HTH transcriptional regulator